MLRTAPHHERPLQVRIIDFIYDVRFDYFCSNLSCNGNEIDSWTLNEII